MCIVLSSLVLIWPHQCVLWLTPALSLPAGGVPKPVTEADVGVLLLTNLREAVRFQPPRAVPSISVSVKHNRNPPNSINCVLRVGL